MSWTWAYGRVPHEIIRKCVAIIALRGWDVSQATSAAWANQISHHNTSFPYTLSTRDRAHCSFHMLEGRFASCDHPPYTRIMRPAADRVCAVPPIYISTPEGPPRRQLFCCQKCITPIIAFLLENHPWVGRGMIGCGRPGPKARPRGNNFLAKHVVIENQCISLEIPYIFENVL